MAMELLSHAAHIKLRHVPYAGAGPALTALLGGHVDALASGPAVVLPQIKAGKLRALAGWGEARVAALPEVPTFKELGYPDAEFYIWAGVFAPKGTPEPVLARLREGLRAAVGDPEFKAAMDKLETPIAFKQRGGVRAVLRRRRQAPRRRRAKSREDRGEETVSRLARTDHGRRSRRRPWGGRSGRGRDRHCLDCPPGYCARNTQEPCRMGTHDSTHI